MAEAPLSNSRLFHDIPSRDREQILAVGVRRSLRKAQVLLRQGEQASTFFLMERGYLKLTQITPEGAEVIVRFVGPGDPVGGVAALGETPYPVTATACDVVNLVAWPRKLLAELLERYPQLKTNILREMTAHMDDALTRLRELATLKVSQRLAHTLLRLSHPSKATGAAAVPPRRRQLVLAFNSQRSQHVARFPAISTPDLDHAAVCVDERGRQRVIEQHTVLFHVDGEFASDAQHVGWIAAGEAPSRRVRADRSRVILQHGRRVERRVERDAEQPRVLR
jgi:CRP-like cAMP-binding protein